MGHLFAAYLRGLRKERCVAQQTLADIIKSDRSNISAIEAGRRRVSDDLIMRISIALNEPYERLLAVKIVDALTPEQEIALYDLLECRRRGRESAE